MVECVFCGCDISSDAHKALCLSWKYRLKRLKKKKTPKNILESMKRYIHSEKGKERRKAYVEKNREKFRKYNVEYLRTLRATVKILGLCAECHKRKAIKELSLCSFCRAKRRK